MQTAALEMAQQSPRMDSAWVVIYNQQVRGSFMNAGADYTDDIRQIFSTSRSRLADSDSSIWTTTLALYMGLILFSFGLIVTQNRRRQISAKLMEQIAVYWPGVIL